MNKIFLQGRLTANPDCRQTQNGISMCRFTIAVDRPYKKDKEKETDFINVTAWRNTADFVARYFTKGKPILVEGSLRNNDYTDQNGVKHYSMCVQADTVNFCLTDNNPNAGSYNNGNNYGYGNSQQGGYGNNGGYQGNYSNGGYSQNAYAQQDGSLDDFEEILNDDSILSSL